MQLHVKSIGGQSPGIVITGGRADLVAFADEIRARAAHVEEGPIAKDVFPAIGDPCDWIQVCVAKNMNHVVRDHDIKTRGILALVAFCFVSLPVLGYLVYRGIRSFF